MKTLRLAVLLLFSAALLAPGSARAGKVGGTLARYALGGIGIGALLGAASATVPYLTDKQGFDFYVGAGAGSLAGVTAGLIFGIVDLATEQAPDETTGFKQQDSAVFAFNAGPTTYLAWKTSF